MEPPPLPLAAVLLPAAGSVLIATGSGLTAAMPALAAERRGGIPPHVLIRSTLAVSRSEHDLELVQLVPLGIGPLPLRNGEQRLQARAGRSRLLFVHGGIISRLQLTPPSRSLR